MKIYMGADHQGVALRNVLESYLKEEGLEVEISKLPNHDLDDYPDFAFDICQKVVENEKNLGILICGNGIGISIAANKVKGIRCARVTNSDDAFKAKNHNGANVIAFGGISDETAKEIVDMFISTKKATEERHLKRINKVSFYESNESNEY
ncbi:MAG: RpiB/LacA/LacB family sugar-phosphate isomerase [Bacilli bacterium]|nr:RpiB/LacA/LacB family sugar-phosphate isomerase [Bacilli bacterium]